MGKIKKGVLGGFIGKTGTVVGTKWRGEYIIKSLPEKSGKPASAAQLKQQARFAMMIQFLKKAKPYIDFGFGTNGTGATPMNEALSYNLRVGIKTTAGVDGIDYTKLLLSKGTLPGGTNVAVTSAAKAINVTWDAYVDEDSDPVNTALRNTDTLAFLLHNPITNVSLRGAMGGTRGAMAAKSGVSSPFIGTPCHLWVFFKSADGKFISDSVYVGLITGVA